MLRYGKTRRHGSRIAWHEADVSKPLANLPHENYDIVMANWVMDHAGSVAELEGMWANVSTYLKPGGRYIGTRVHGDPRAQTSLVHKYGLIFKDQQPIPGGVLYRYETASVPPIDIEATSIEVSSRYIYIFITRLPHIFPIVFVLYFHTKGRNLVRRCEPVRIPSSLLVSVLPKQIPFHEAYAERRAIGHEFRLALANIQAREARYRQGLASSGVEHMVLLRGWVLWKSFEQSHMMPSRIYKNQSWGALTATSRSRLDPVVSQPTLFRALSYPPPSHSLIILNSPPFGTRSTTTTWSALLATPRKTQCLGRSANRPEIGERYHPA
ncbi:hypothetical protein GGR54DRAFT_625669 [Hypoxylon sp. NC1633]|nr:hypothetical protein GGR54DRAFT_625669 [Hypoxylon sp. NC1633]